MGRWITIGLVVIGIIAVGFVVVSAIFPGFRETARDISVVIIAVFQVIGSILTIALLVAVLYAVKAIRDLSQTSILPKVELLTTKLDQVIENTGAITNSAKGTAATVSSATGYVTEQLVAPIIRLSGLFAGVRAAVAFLARREPPAGS